MPIASCKWEAFPFFENREDCHGRRGALPSELGALWLYSLPYEITSSLPGPMPFCVLVSHEGDVPLVGAKLWTNDQLAVWRSTDVNPIIHIG